MSPAPIATLNANATDWALFLDFDGTLVEIAEHPDAIIVPPDLPVLLRDLAKRLNGAIAIVSGRSIAGLDTLLDGALPAMAGVHGLERRDAAGQLFQAVDKTSEFTKARASIRNFVAAHPGTHWEDKGNALALHSRNAPEAGPAALAMLSAEQQSLGDEFILQKGKQVLELKPSGQHKGTVVETYMSEAPFKGRLPVFLGDDVTDEDAFAVVNAQGGHSIRVGHAPHSIARYQIDTVNEALEWLSRL